MHEITIDGRRYSVNLKARTIQPIHPEPCKGQVWRILNAIYLIVRAPQNRLSAVRLMNANDNGYGDVGNIWSDYGVFGPPDDDKDDREYLGTFQEWLRTKCASPCG